MRKLCILLALALFMPFLGASFYDVSLSVTMKINTNGSAHVTEKVMLSLDTSSEDLYSRSIYSRELTIMDWQQITNSQYLRQHIISSVAARNMRITPEDVRPFAYGSRSGASIKLEYDVDKIVAINQTGPRTLLYALNSSALSFQPSPSGEVLPRNNDFTIIIPPGSVVTSISPDPTQPAIQRDYADQVRGVSNFTWSGTVSLMEFKFAFTREEPMDVEVRNFFENLESMAISIMLSAPGIVLMLFVILAAAFFVLRTR
ncbi:hypothetical protein H0N98_05515 [Candidatus Micrarchaeota archaeon]|nr:hypothetical protein [Candidatus Micrarchaeota archaeon]